MSPGGAEGADLSFAAERTALAWQRTGMTLMATGMALLRLLPSSPWRPAVSLVAVVVGAVVTLGARRRHPSDPRRLAAAALAATVAAMALAGAVLAST